MALPSHGGPPGALTGSGARPSLHGLVPVRVPLVFELPHAFRDAVPAGDRRAALLSDFLKGIAARADVEEMRLDLLMPPSELVRVAGPLTPSDDRIARELRAALDEISSPEATRMALERRAAALDARLAPIVVRAVALREGPREANRHLDAVLADLDASPMLRRDPDRITVMMAPADPMDARAIAASSRPPSGLAASRTAFFLAVNADRVLPPDPGLLVDAVSLSRSGVVENASRALDPAAYAHNLRGVLDESARLIAARSLFPRPGPEVGRGDAGRT